MIKVSNRTRNLFVGKMPKWVRVYSNLNTKNESFDCFTVVYTKKAIVNERELETGEKYVYSRSFVYLGMSEKPYHPQGFGQHGESEHDPIDKPTYSHLGRKIKFSELPTDCQHCAIETYLDLWNISKDEYNQLIKENDE